MAFPEDRPLVGHYLFQTVVLRVVTKMNGSLFFGFVGVGWSSLCLFVFLVLMFKHNLVMR